MKFEEITEPEVGDLVKVKSSGVYFPITEIIEEDPGLTTYDANRPYNISCTSLYIRLLPNDH